ncbi:unnamed protein product, partial [Enterobius vermicularis]|uniref:WD_REPEATS_REGION domain-containing protein n=1 Tax=Enterobius vermicularis TaxID=51028 RepID=A0A0N4UST6_ENTVE
VFRQVYILGILFFSGKEGVRYVERFYASSLVAYVLHRCPRKARVYNIKERQDVCTLNCKNTIMAVKMNREVSAVLSRKCFSDGISYFSIFSTLWFIHHEIYDVPGNKEGIIDITSEGPSLVAYPGAAEVGKVNLFDVSNNSPFTTISAHKSPLATVRFNSTGTFIATSSTKGTVIRVFNVESGDKFYEFSRGVSRLVLMTSLDSKKFFAFTDYSFSLFIIFLYVYLWYFFKLLERGLCFTKHAHFLLYSAFLTSIRMGNKVQCCLGL